MEEFIDSEIYKCPFCKKVLEYYGTPKIKGDMCYVPWKCKNCKHEGDIWYYLKFVCFNVSDEKIDYLILKGERGD